MAYIVMPYYSNGTIRQYLKRAELALAEFSFPFIFGAPFGQRPTQTFPIDKFFDSLVLEWRRLLHIKSHELHKRFICCTVLPPETHVVTPWALQEILRWGCC